MGTDLRIFALLLAACAATSVLNHFRGAGNQWLRFLLGVPVALLVLANWRMTEQYSLAGLQQTLLTCSGLFAGIYLFFTQPWGRWYSVGCSERWLAGPADEYESVFEEAFAFRQLGRAGSDIACWLSSSLIFAMPLALLCWQPLLMLLSPALVATYGLVWHTKLHEFKIFSYLGPASARQIRVCETLFGAVLVLVCFFSVVRP